MSPTPTAFPGLNGVTAPGAGPGAPPPAPPPYDPALFPHRARLVATVEVTGPRGGARVVPGTPGPTLACSLEPRPPARQPWGAPAPAAAAVSVTAVLAFFPADPGVPRGAALQGLLDWAGRTLVALGPSHCDGPGLWKCELEEKV